MMFEEKYQLHSQDISSISNTGNHELLQFASAMHFKCRSVFFIHKHETVRDY